MPRTIPHRELRNNSSAVLREASPANSRGGKPSRQVLRVAYQATKVDELAIGVGFLNS